MTGTAEHTAGSSPDRSDASGVEADAPFSDATSLRFGTPQIFAPPLQLPVATMLEHGEKRTVEIGRVSPICEPSRTVFFRSLKTLRRTSRMRGSGSEASARCWRSRR